ncbi:unnamed protein product, partial [Chrysoparadoxa australica]
PLCLLTGCLCTEKYLEGGDEKRPWCLEAASADTAQKELKQLDSGNMGGGASKQQRTDGAALLRTPRCGEPPFQIDSRHLLDYFEV